MAPPTTPPNPAGDWLSVNVDGSLTIRDPPPPKSTARNDSRQRVHKDNLFAAVPCSLTQPMRLYRSIMFDNEGDARNFNVTPTGAFPFSEDVVNHMGDRAIIQDGPLQSHVHGRITSQSDFRADGDSWQHVFYRSFFLIVGNPFCPPSVYA